jgi:hypothetical protein
LAGLYFESRVVRTPPSQKQEIRHIQRKGSSTVDDDGVGAVGDTLAVPFPVMVNWLKAVATVEEKES